MRRYLFLGIVAAIAAVLAVVPTMSAFAATGGVLTVGSAGGTNVNAGDTVGASLASGTNAVFTVGSGKVTCTSSSFTATVSSNPASGGTAAESLTAQSFGGCTASGIFGVRGINSITVNNLSYAATVSSSGATAVTAGSAGPVQATVSVASVLGNITCIYQATNGLSGTASNSDNSLSFTNQPFSKSSGPATCNSSVSLTVKYGPITDSSQGGQSVFTN